MNRDYDGRQYVGIDLHRRRSVIVRMSEEGQRVSWVRIDNDPVALGLELAKAGPDPEVVLEATYGPTIGPSTRCGPLTPVSILRTRWA